MLLICTKVQVLRVFFLFCHVKVNFILQGFRKPSDLVRRVPLMLRVCKFWLIHSGNVEHIPWLTAVVLIMQRVLYSAFREYVPAMFQYWRSSCISYYVLQILLRCLHHARYCAKREVFFSLGVDSAVQLHRRCRGVCGPAILVRCVKTDDLK